MQVPEPRLELPQQLYEDASIEAVKGFAHQVLQYAINRFGGSDDFNEICSARLAGIKESAQVYEQHKAWYENDFLPAKKKLESQQNSKMNEVSMKNAVIDAKTKAVTAKLERLKTLQLIK